MYKDTTATLLVSVTEFPEAEVRFSSLNETCNPIHLPQSECSVSDEVYKNPSQEYLQLVPMMTLSLLILLSLSTLISSDSLSHFQEVIADDITNVKLVEDIEYGVPIHKLDSGNHKNPPDTVFDGSPESCAKVCLMAKFYCQSFIVMSIKEENGESKECFLHDDGMDERLLKNWLEEGEDKLEAAYECVSRLHAQDLCSRIKEKVDNVKTISNDPTLLSEARFNELLAGYGMSESLVDDWDDIVAFVKGCIAALDVSQSELTNFEEWLSGKKSPEQPTSGSTPKYTSNYEQTSKRRKLNPNIPRTKSNIRRINSNIPGVDILTFLDLFSRGIDERTQTIYDPEKGILYIHSPDIQLLIIVYQNGDYVYAASGNKVSSDSAEIGGSKARLMAFFKLSEEWIKKEWTSKVDSEEITKGLDTAKAYRYFCSAVIHSGHEVARGVKFSPRVGGFDNQIWTVVKFLIGSHEDYLHPHHLLLGRDLSKAVPIIHRKWALPFTGQGRTSLPYGDVQVITFEKDVEL